MKKNNIPLTKLPEGDRHNTDCYVLIIDILWKYWKLLEILLNGTYYFERV